MVDAIVDRVCLLVLCRPTSAPNRRTLAFPRPLAASRLLWSEGAGSGYTLKSASVPVSDPTQMLTFIPWLKVGFRVGKMTFSLSYCPF